MTPAEIQNEVSDLINIAYRKGYEKCGLIFLNNALLILPHSKLKSHTTVFFNFKLEHLRDGLTAGEWDTLTRNVLAFFEGEKPCQKNLIP